MNDLLKMLRGLGELVSVGHVAPPAGTYMFRAADRIEKLEEALHSIAKVPRSEAAYGIIQVLAKYALEGKDE
jgi:hypothetical protein